MGTARPEGDRGSTGQARQSSRCETVYYRPARIVTQSSAWKWSPQPWTATTSGATGGTMRGVSRGHWIFMKIHFSALQHPERSVYTYKNARRALPELAAARWEPTASAATAAVGLPRCGPLPGAPSSLCIICISSRCREHKPSRPCSLFIESPRHDPRRDSPPKKTPKQK